MIAISHDDDADNDDDDDDDDDECAESRFSFGSITRNRFRVPDG